MAKRCAPMTYSHALAWLLDNDNCEWLDTADAPQSVTAAFVADCYQRTDEELRRDLHRKQAVAEARA